MSWLFHEKLTDRYSRFAPAANKWWGLCCCDVPKLYIIFTGTVTGVGNTLTSQKYRSTTNAWTTAASGFVVRTHPFYGSFGDYVLSACGATLDGLGQMNPTNRTDRYSFTSNSWINRNMAPTPRTGMYGGMAYNGTMLFVGLGNITNIGGDVQLDSNYPFTFERNVIASDSWFNSTSVSTDNRELGTLSAIGNLGWAIGGRRPPLPFTLEERRYNNNDEMDMSTETWSVATDLPVERTGVVAIPLDGNNYISSGRVWDTTPFPDAFVATNETNEYNPNTGSWTTKTDMPTGGASNGPDGASGVSDYRTNIGYVLGGGGGSGNHYGYTPDVWTLLAPAGVSRAAHGAG